MKKTLAIITVIAMLMGCISFGATAAEEGTYESPLAATSFMGSFLMNNTLQPGDSDGIWYTFTASSAGIVCVENSVQDANGNKIYNYQVAVEVGGKTYYANDTVFSNPVHTFRVTKGTVVKVGMWMLPDSEGAVPYGKMYVSASVVSGLDSDPVKVKSPTGFIASVGSNRTVNYLDGSTGGVYTGKGVVLEGDADVIAKTTVIYGTTEYTDFDGDGKIEFSFPKGAEGAMIAPHYAFSITNEAAKDAVLVFRLTDSAEEGNYEPSTGHTIAHVASIDPTCLETGMQEYWYCETCDKAYSDESCAVIMSIESLTVPAAGHSFEDGVCTECGEPEFVVTLGDIDNNGVINGKDSYALKVILSGSSVATDSEMEAADVNADGVLNGKDSNLLAQFVAGAITSF